MTRKLAISSFALMLSMMGVSHIASAQAFNPYGTYAGGTSAAKDPNQPAQGRSNFVSSVEELADGSGAKLTVDFYHGDKNLEVSLWLQVAINDGKGNVKSVPFKVLSDKIADNSTNYHSRREFILKYADLNKELHTAIPQLAHITIGPGSPLVLDAYWHSYSHTWGGLDRFGIFFMPQDAASALKAQENMPQLRRTEELDIAMPIGEGMINKYNAYDPKTKTSHGLLPGGQIRSRMEMEGKFQVPLDTVTDVKKKLFELANNPALASQILGADWTIEAEMRYMRKNKAGNLMKSRDGFPIPDPMVDTYKDNPKFEAAQLDMAVRYRFTKGNNSGAWNFKPGYMVRLKSGSVFRPEYALDSTDDKSKTIKSFVDSADPMNFFSIIPARLPKAKASDFMQNAIKIDDERFKFKMKHKNGLVVEVSLDNVDAIPMRDKREKVKFAQLEMDVDHLATSSTNTATGVGFWGGVSNQGKIDTTFTDALTTEAFLDGRPTIHTMKDMEPTSPLRKKNDKDFGMADKAITALRDHTLGENWLPAPQKYALAAAVLGYVPKSKQSPSVRKLYREIEKRKEAGKDPGVMFETKSANMCRSIFGI